MALELCGTYIWPFHTQEAAATVILQVCEVGMAEGLALPENIVTQLLAVLGPSAKPAVRPSHPVAGSGCFMWHEAVKSIKPCLLLNDGGLQQCLISSTYWSGTLHSPCMQRAGLRGHLHSLAPG